MYLLDTNVLSNLVKRAPSAALIAKVATVPHRDQFTSSITVGELIYGALRARDRQQYWVRQIEQRLLPNVQILSFNRASAYRYAEVRVELQRHGTPIAEADLRIAATALAYHLILVTDNVRYFQRVPNLALENWLT